VRRQTLMGRKILDPAGERVGRVLDTWPYDGGGEVEMVVVRLALLGESRMLPVASLSRRHDGDLQTPFARRQVEDSPALEDGRHALAATERAVSHWSWEEPEAGTLTRRWQRSSGFFAMARQSPTTQSPTTTAS
jgi:hypothetical protein